MLVTVANWPPSICEGSTTGPTNEDFFIVNFPSSYKGEGEEGGFCVYFEPSDETPLLPLPLLGEGVKKKERKIEKEKNPFSGSTSELPLSGSLLCGGREGR